MTRIILTADLHFGTEDKSAIAASLNAIPELNADALIIAGDLTQRGKHSEFQAAKDWLEAIDLPSLIVPGNHDTPLLNMVSRVSAPFERYETYFGGLTPHLDIKDTAFWGLNTARGWQARANWAEGSVNQDRLKDRLKDAAQSKAKLRALVCHHPFIPAPGAPLHTRTRKGKSASEALGKSAFHLLLTGHVHTPTAQICENSGGQYLAIGAGTLSTRLRDHPPGFITLELEGSEIQVNTHDFEHNNFNCKPLGKFNLESLEQNARSDIAKA